jgi:hypothetical protein
VPDAGGSEAEVTLDRLALEGTKQIQPNAPRPCRPAAGFANRIADEIICKETKVLEEIIPRMFEVMYRVAQILSDYIKRGGQSSSGCGKC